MKEPFVKRLTQLARKDSGGFSYGALGISHHATEDLAIMRNLPDITVIAPDGEWEAMEATSAVVRTPGTRYLRLDKDPGDDPPRNGENFAVGRGRLLSNGADCTIIVTGGILKEAQNAAALLASKPISARVVSMHTIKPIDSKAILDAARDTGGMVTVEEHKIHGGLGGAVAEVLMDHDVMPKRFLRIGLEAGFSSIVGSQEYLRRCYRMDAESIASRVEHLLLNRR